MSLVFRHEYKHEISYVDYLTLVPRLRTIMRSDQHTDKNGRYHIRSLYFDNLNDKALREKLDGVNERDKFRIRYYNHDSNFILLEKKSKRKSLCQKASVVITKEECELLLRKNLTWMNSKKQGLFTQLYTKLNCEQFKPKTIVDYVREPYTYEPGNVRVTFDMDIRTGLYSTDFLSDKVAVIPAYEPGMIILEIKFDEYLPDPIKNMIQVKACNCCAFSKYAVCRRFD